MRVSALSTAVSRRSFVVAGAAGGFALAAPAPAQTQKRNLPMEKTISSSGDIITLVNVFTVEPASLQKLVDALKDGTESFFSQMPGFVSSSVLTVKGGAQAINYSQWRTAKDIAAFRQDSRFAPYLQRLLALAQAQSFECEVAYVHRA
jgi:hypothetical protein